MWEIFSEAFLSNTLWQFTSEVRYFAMYAFGGHDMLVPTLVSIIGALLASYANNFLGLALSKMQDDGRFKISQEQYARWQARANVLIWPVGLFCWIHLVGVLVFGAGFLRVPQWKILVAVFIGQTAYYLYYYLTSIGVLTAS